MTATETPSPVFIPTVQADAPVVRYSITEAMIAKYRDDFGKLIITDSKTEQAVRSALTTMVRTRTGIEAEYKVLTAEANERIKLIRAEKNRIIAELAPTEEHLQAEWDRVQAEKARKKAEEEAARAKALQDRIDAENAARKAELEREAAEVAAAKKALEESRRKLEEQQAAARAKAEEEQRIAREREEAARRERERLEAIEREERRQLEESAAKAERERLAKIEAEQRAERERLEAERRAVESEKERLRLEQEAKEKAERLAREAEERRIAELERAAALKTREEALRPDKEKIAAWATELRKIAPPKVSDAEAAVVVGEAMAAIRNIVATRLEAFAGVEGKVAS